jgi:hypothetical protein
VAASNLPLFQLSRRGGQMKWFLDWLERRGRKLVIMDRVNNEPYLERYYVFLKDRKRFPFNVFLHKFLKSDPDDVHDHPWPYATLILKGGYWEWQPLFDANRKKIGETSTWRGAGSFRTASATSYHRIELDPDVECWTLFMPGQQQREWGFLIGNFWVQWQDYLAQKAKLR